MYRYCAKEDDGLTEGAYCSCTAGYEIYACQPYSLSACHLSMLHHHGLTRTALCLSKNLVAKTAYHVMTIHVHQANQNKAEGVL
jgi:hypothetical protein